ncbi:MAG: alpha/beta hydrolase [Betaproteobacteria bacterium]|nr:alpha/beta hydrolase [Betaproteobacteria bacterium]
MPATFSLPRISTNVRFATTALLAPDLAGAWAERLFLTPPQPKFPESEFFDLIDARSSFVEHRGRKLATWRWGPQDAPAVLLSHGWGGRATQMRGFVFHLAAAGFRVIAFDQPAHGLSEGRFTGLPDFADAFAAIARHHGGVRAVIGHSLGATAAALAMAHGLQIERAVLISPPSDVIGFSRRFARWHWMPERVRHAMQDAIEERFGVRWADLEVGRFARKLEAAALVIHDRDDSVVPAWQGARLARVWPGARLLLTDGLGHGRILADEAITRAAADFIAGRSGIAGQAHATLPNPSPLY